MKIAMLFPGYGSQFVGMGKSLYDEHRVMQEYFEQASTCIDVNFVKLCFASSEIELAKMTNAMPAIFLTSASIYKILKEEEGIVPSIVAGYNIGEISALYASGGISFADGLYIVNKYCAYYQELLSGLDVALIKVSGLQAETLKAICEQYSTNDVFASIAIYISENENIVSGYSSVVQMVAEAAKESGAKIESLGIEVGLHNSLMKPVADYVKLYLEKVDFKDANIKFLSSTEVDVTKSGLSGKAAVLEYITSPLRWSQTLDYMRHYDVLVEVGPGSTLSKTVKAMYPEKQIFSINNQKDIDALVALVTGGEKKATE